MIPTLARLHHDVLPMLGALLLGAVLIVVILRRPGALGGNGDRPRAGSCPACRHVNPAAARYCAMCGRRLAPPEGPVP
ncbi:MAG: zinc ribbon domain-containing protein [Planctomycetota bacterium]